MSRRQIALNIGGPLVGLPRLGDVVVGGQRAAGLWWLVPAVFLISVLLLNFVLSPRRNPGHDVPSEIFIYLGWLTFFVFVIVSTFSAAQSMYHLSGTRGLTRAWVTLMGATWPLVALTLFLAMAVARPGWSGTETPVLWRLVPTILMVVLGAAIAVTIRRTPGRRTPLVSPSTVVKPPRAWPGQARGLWLTAQITLVLLCILVVLLPYQRHSEFDEGAYAAMLVPSLLGVLWMYGGAVEADAEGRNRSSAVSEAVVPAPSDGRQLVPEGQPAVVYRDRDA